MPASISIAESRKGFGGGGYSSVVQLYLELDGSRMPLRQVGDGELYFSEPVSLPSKKAKLIIEVDGEITVREIELAGNVESSRVVRFS